MASIDQDILQIRTAVYGKDVREAIAESIEQLDEKGLKNVIDGPDKGVIEGQVAANTAAGQYAHAEGLGTAASGNGAHAEGYYTQATGKASHAEGGAPSSLRSTKATGNFSHAEGNITTASGDYSHSEGCRTTSAGQGSHAEGEWTTASNKSQHVFGECNAYDGSSAAATERGNYIEIVGNGTTSNRSNARTLDWSGNERLAGDLYVQCENDSTGGIKVATEEDVGELNSAVEDTALIANKNYIPKIITGTYAINGLYFVVNADNSITVNGTASAATDYYILNTRDSNNVRLDLIEGKHYTLSSGADFKDGVVYRLITGGGSNITQGIGRDIDIIAGKYVVLILRISNGVSFSDWHIYPMIRDTVYNDDYKAGRDYYGLSDGVSKALIPVIGECADSEITKAASLYNGIRISSEIADNVITTMVDSSIAAHDGTLLFNNGMLYAVYCTYTGNQGDAAVNPNAKVMLTKCAVDGSNKSSIIIAENGGTYAGVEQTGGSGNPNAYIADGKICILYVANMNNTYVEMEAEYDLSNNAIAYHKVQVDNSDLNNAWINSHYGKNYNATNYLYAQANSTIAYDGTAYYIGWVYGVYEDYGAIIFKTTDFVNWEIFYEYDGAVVPSYEFPLAFLNGALCCAIRPKTAGYGLYFQIANRHVSNTGYFPNCSSRPAFFVHGTTLFMVTNISSREHMEIYRIDQSAVQNSIKEFDCCMGANYPSFALDSTNNVMYFLRTNSNMQLSKFEFNFTSESAVQDVIASAWSLA